jgi:hypothetical protein
MVLVENGPATALEVTYTTLRCHLCSDKCGILLGVATVLDDSLSPRKTAQPADEPSDITAS